MEDTRRNGIRELRKEVIFPLSANTYLHKLGPIAVTAWQGRALTTVEAKR